MKNLYSKMLNRGLAVLIALVLTVSGIPMTALAENEHAPDDYEYATSGVNVGGDDTEEVEVEQDEDADEQDHEPDDTADDTLLLESGGDESCVCTAFQSNPDCPVCKDDATQCAFYYCVCEALCGEDDINTDCPVCVDDYTSCVMAVEVPEIEAVDSSVSTYASLLTDMAAPGTATITLSTSLSGTSQLTVNGNKTLDLNGKTLTITLDNSENENANGIKIAGGELTIEDSTDGGTLDINVSVDEFSYTNGNGAAINTSDGTLIVNSGTIKAITNSIGCGSAGIGGGAGEDGGTITINGGTITASGSTSGAGIGGGGGTSGQGGDSGTIAISGGTVTAISGSELAVQGEMAIGKAHNGSNGTITFSGDYDYWVNTTNSAPAEKTGSGTFTNSETYKYVKLMEITDEPDTPITSAAITVTAPVVAATPVTTAPTGGTDYTCGAVSWSPSDSPFKGGAVYTATVTLTASEGYTFTGLTTATINGETATVTNNDGGTVTLSYTFAATAKSAVTNAGGSASVTYAGTTIDLSTLGSLFTVDSNAGTRTYTVETDDTGTGSIGADNKTLTVTKAGTITIGLVTAATTTHEAGAKVTATLTVSKGNQSAPAAPTSTGKTDTTVTLTANSNMEFSKDGTNWQTSNVFSGLTANTTYSFYQRLKETDLYNASPASPALSVTTDKTALTGTATITINGGTLKIGATLTANTSGLPTTPGTLTYEWKAGGSTVGTDSSTYTVTAADLGKTITVTVSAANYSGSLISAATTTVPYTIQLVKSGNTGADDVYFDTSGTMETYAVSGGINISYVLSGTGTKSNGITYSGATSSITAVTSAGSGISIYTINDSDASSGVVTITVTFSHTDKDDVIITETAQTYTYDGTAKAFSISGTPATGFTVTYNQGGGNVTPTNAGTYNVVITRAADANYTAYSKTITGGLVISPLDISGISVTADFSTTTYNGSAQTPAPTSVSFGGANVTSGTDYTLGSYSSNTNAGTASVVINGTSNYSGTKSVNFTINAKSLTLVADNKTILVGDSEPAYTYTVNGLAGSDTKDTVITTEPTLSVTGFSNASPTTFVIAISGGAANTNYTIATRTNGTLTVTSKNNVSTSIAFADGSATYDGTAKTHETAGVSGITAGANPTWTYTYTAGTGTLSGGKPLTAGTYTVTAKYEDDDNIGTQTATFTINPRSISNAAIAAITDQTYTGSAIEPMPSVSDNGAVITANDYDVSYNNNTNIGTATVTLTGKNNYTGSKTATFNIVAIPLTSAAITVTAPVKGVAPNTTANGEVNYTCSAVTWSPNQNPFQGGTAFTATVTLTASDGYTFTGITTATINGNTAMVTNNTGAAVTLSYQFPALPSKAVIGISVKTPPNLVYVAGDKLNLAALVVKVDYDDTTTEDIAYNKAGLTYQIDSTAVTSGTTVMSNSKHDGKSVVVSYGGQTVSTSALTVYAPLSAQISVSDIDATSAKFTYSATADSRNTVTSKLQVKSDNTWADVSGASSPHTASGLSPNTSYEYRIWAKDTTTNRETTKPVTFKTAPTATPPGVTVSGTVTDNGPPPPASITVTIERGNTVIASVIVTGSGTYNFSFTNLPNGIYNLVSDNGSYKVTQAVAVTGVDVTGISIDMASGKTQSIIDIVTPDTPPAAVDGLPDLFADATIYNATDIDLVDNHGGTVEIKLTVEAKDNPADAGKINDAASEQTVGLYLDLSMLKSLFDDTGALLDETKLTDLNGNLITITFELPDDLKGKSDLTIYRVHGKNVDKLTSTPNADGESAVISDGIVTLNVCKFSTYAITYTPSNPSPPSPPSSGGSNGGGSSGGGGGGGTAPAIISTYWIEVPEAKAMAKSAKEQGAEIARSRRATITGIRKASLAVLADAGLRYQHDTVANGAVQVRVSVDDPAAAIKDILVTGYVTGDTVDKTKAIFGKWYPNKVAVVCFDQQGDFGLKVQIAARVDLSGMDTNNLYFYSYDKATNKYKRILTEYRIDSKGYLHFATTLTGSIIITDTPLSGNAEPQNPSTGGDDISPPILGRWISRRQREHIRAANQISQFICSHPELKSVNMIEFSDDGYSGTNFERPGVSELLKQVRSGAVQCIIVKDFSRFGRNYIEVGDYIEQIFPFLRVRFISINDAYDSETQGCGAGDVSIAFKHLCNDYYCKDLSRKVKSGYRTKWEQGKYLASYDVYGYQRSGEDKYKLITDDVTAPVVRRIFYAALAGSTPPKIAAALNTDGVPTPLEYPYTKEKCPFMERA